MRLLHFLILYFSFSFVLNAQKLNGKVYDAKATVNGIKIYNKTQKRLTATNQEGNFEIEAKVNDTILFESLFHHPKKIILQSYHFNEIAVFELKKLINELDEVEIIAAPEQPVFKEETYNKNLRNIIAEDIKRNPEKYQPVGATYGVDFIYLIGQIAKLFKSKKSNIKNYRPITYEQLDSLTTKSSMFNDKLLTKDLKIPIKNKYLFFEFIEAKQISSELLLEKNKIYLLDKLIINSQLFLILLEQYGNQKEIKD
ncbi:carboxypeptidase-like regulatory domain-containing protein [Winogradskyella sp.]|nr:carboxypeptidase-like regulatory domain-containing protein [Winogradskyella sp.]